MKKIFTSLFATVAVFCASAAVPTYTVNPTSGSTIENRAFNVTFTFSEAVTVNEVEFIGGARFNSTISTGTVSMAAPSTKVTVSVPDDVWGTPQGGEYLLTVNLPAIYDKNGNQITITETSEEGETFSYAYTADASYTSPYDVEAEYLGLDPDPATTTVWDVYSEGWGFVNFLFSGEVALTEESWAEIIFTLTDGEVKSIEVEPNDLWADWDWWTGSFAITVPMYPMEDLTQNNLKELEVVLHKVQNGASTINELVADYNLMTLPSENAINKHKARSTTGISLPVNSDVVNVYNISGNIVIENASNSDIKSLAPGLYIANGKKFIVR